MSTAYNSSIKLYKRVPLVKGGTEVLYLSQAAAEGALSAFLLAEYTEYYFVRDNRRAVQIDAPFGSCDDVNYISFKNSSHGGKIFFAFVDRVIYINDNCTQIEFTIDPWPTYSGDAKQGDFILVERNTPKNPERRTNLVPDYNNGSILKIYHNLHHFAHGPLTQAVVYFCDSVRDSIDIGGSGIKVDVMTNATVKSIQEDGGVIIGAYVDIFGGVINNYANIITPLPDITLTPLQFTSSAKWPKINTGLYNDLLLISSNSAKQYDIEDFDNPLSVTFGALICVIPSPMIYLYPKNYRNVAHNLGEGVALKVPSLPITANATYTDAQFMSDVKSTATAALGGAVAGLVKGGAAGAALGAITGAVGGILNMGFNRWNTQFKAPTIIGTGEPILNQQSTLVADFVVVTPSGSDITRIERYMDAYGYQWDEVMPKASVNTEDGAFLQTGDMWLAGSEADDQLNAMLMRGLVLRQTLQPRS